MGDSVLVTRVQDAADIAFQIHCLERSAYAAVLRAFCAQSDLLSRAKEDCLAELRNELKILESEHRECLGKARSNKQINSLSAGSHSKGSTCNTEFMKDACVLPDAGDTVFQIHCLERSAYASLLRAFCAVKNHLSWLQVKLLTKLRNELRISHIEHKEVLVKVSSNENIKSLRKFSLVTLSVLTKTDHSFDAHAMVHDKNGSTGQVSTSSTSCLSLLQQSPTSEHSMSTTRDTGISDISNCSKEGPYFEPHAVVSAKRLKSVNRHAPSVQLPVAVSVAMVKGRTDDTLDTETIPCEVKSGCTPLIFQEKLSKLNASQVPSCVDHAREESGKRKAEVPGMRVSTSLGVMGIKYGIKYQRLMNKDSDLDHGSEIINLCLTASLLHKVERLLREKPCPANLEKAKSILETQEKDLLDALVKLSAISYDVAYFSANGQPDNINTHDDGKSKEEMLPKPVNSSDETPPGTARLGGGGEGDHFKIQGVAAAALSPSSANPTSGTTSSSPVIRQLLGSLPLTQTRLHVPASPSSAPGALGQSSGGRSTAPPPHATLMAVASPPAPIKKRSKTTAEQRSRMREFAYRVGWSIHKAGAGAVDAFCAQVGVPRRALRIWMVNNRHLAKIPPPSLPSPPLPSRHQEQDHSPAATPPQGSVTEDGKPPEPEGDHFKMQGVAAAALSPSSATPTGSTTSSSPVIPQLSAPIKKRSKTTAEQRSRMREFAYRVGWSIRKAGAGAVDAFCAQVGVPRRALRMWMANNRHLARIPPPSLPSPPLPSRQQDQDHSPAATPPQGSVTEDGKPPEPEAAAPADDGGKEDGNEEASDEVTQIGRGHRSRKPNKRYGGHGNSIWM